MRVAIMQPTWLPWMGYFDLINQVDLFVFLDIVQFSNQSWQCRNQIKTRQGSKWISLPVSTGTMERHHSQYNDHPSRIPHKEVPKTLQQEYSGARAFKSEFPGLTEHLSDISDGACLAEVNIDFIHFAMDRLQIPTQTVRAETLPEFDGRVMRLIEICRLFNADTYVSAPGSADYIGREGVKCFEEAGIDLVFQRYDHPIYQQWGAGFLSSMSIIDLLLNVGEQAGAILRSGHRDPIPARQFFHISRKSPLHEKITTTQLDQWRGKFGDIYSDRNAETAERVRVYTRAYGRMWECIAADPPATILECGCNVGMALHALSNITSAELYGIEPNATARAKAIASGVTAEGNIVEGCLQSNSVSGSAFRHGVHRKRPYPCRA